MSSPDAKLSSEVGSSMPQGISQELTEQQQRNLERESSRPPFRHVRTHSDRIDLSPSTSGAGHESPELVTRTTTTSMDSSPKQYVLTTENERIILPDSEIYSPSHCSSNSHQYKNFTKENRPNMIPGTFLGTESSFAGSNEAAGFKFQEEIRKIIAQTSEMKKIVELKLTGVQTDRKRMKMSINFLYKFLDDTRAQKLIAAERIHLRNQCEAEALKRQEGGGEAAFVVNPVKDQTAMELNVIMDTEFYETQHSIYKIENYISYGLQIVSYLVDLEKRLSVFLEHTVESIVEEKRSLASHTQKPSTAPSGTSRAAKGKQKQQQQQPRHYSTQDLNFRQIFADERTVRNAAGKFIHKSSECIKKETDVLKVLQRKTNISIRHCRSESLKKQLQIKEEITSLQNRMPTIGQKALDLKAALNELMKPLQVCQERLELRRQRMSSSAQNVEGGSGEFGQGDTLQARLQQEMSMLRGKMYAIEVEFSDSQNSLKIMHKLLMELEKHLEFEKQYGQVLKSFMSDDGLSSNERLEKQLRKEIFTVKSVKEYSKGTSLRRLMSTKHASASERQRVQKRSSFL